MLPPRCGLTEGSQVSAMLGRVEGNVDYDPGVTGHLQGNMKRLVGGRAGRKRTLSGGWLEMRLWEDKPSGRVCS